MHFDLFDGNRAHLLGHVSRQPFIQGHAEMTHTARVKSKRRC
jgi:hypothetical protein